MTLERKHNKNLIHEFNILSYENGHMCIYNMNKHIYKYTMEWRRERNCNTQEYVRKKLSRSIYKQILKRLKYNNIKDYWFNINITFDPDLNAEDLSTSSVDELCAVNMAYIYDIKIRLSSRSYNRLKILDIDFCDMLNDKSGIKFRELIPYRC